MIQRNLLYFYKLVNETKTFLNIKYSAILTAAGTEKVKEFCRQAPVETMQKPHINYTFLLTTLLK